MTAAGPQHPHELAETRAPNMQELTINASTAADDCPPVDAAFDMEAVGATAERTGPLPLATSGRLQARAALRPCSRFTPLTHPGVSTLVAADQFVPRPQGRTRAFASRSSRR